MTGGDGRRSLINVTPLVDVVLVLLIIFMVIVPVSRRGYDLDVPVQAGPAERPPANDLEQVVLSVAAADCQAPAELPELGLPPGCRVSLDDRQVDATVLAGATERLFAARAETDPVLFLDADDELEYELVMRVLDAARSRVPGLRIGLVAEPRSSSTLISRTTPTGAVKRE